MQKWEYLFLSVDIGGLGDDRIRLYSVNDERMGKKTRDFLGSTVEYPDMSREEFREYMTKLFNDLGDDGWELIDKFNYEFIFKRPKPEQ